jgi:hypothetical protein
VITVVVDPFSRLILVTVVSALPVCDVVEVVEVAEPALSGRIIVVVLDGGAATGGSTAAVWAAAGSANNKRRPNSGTMGFMSVKRLAARIVRQQGRPVADKVNHSLTGSVHLLVAGGVLRARN